MLANGPPQGEGEGGRRRRLSNEEIASLRAELAQAKADAASVNRRRRQVPGQNDGRDAGKMPFGVTWSRAETIAVG